MKAAERHAKKTMTTAQRQHLKRLRHDRRWWEQGCPGGHVDYCLLPGTDEGDASTAHRQAQAARLAALIRIYQRKYAAGE